MTDSELYLLIKNSNYIHTTNDLDYQIIHKDGLCILYFQETRSQSDWKVNFDFPCKIYRNGKLWVHRGYGNTYKAAKDEIMAKFLLEIKDGEIPLISGWSYGASLALLASEDYYYHTHTPIDCVTFGGAKICYTFGTVRYLRKIARITEYTQINDFVTWVAPWCIRIHKKKVGDRFSFKKLFNTAFNHCNYDKVIYN